VARRRSRLDNRPEFRVWNWRSPGWAGDLKGCSRALAADPGSGIAGGATSWKRPGLWLVADLFLPASGSGCGLLGLCRIATKITANRTARGPNVRAAGATGGMAGRKKSADDNK